jgi:hypothetical protein
MSQDRHEIYLTFATFDSSYVRYLKEGTKEGEPFLRMYEFGPFDIRKVGHMKKVGEVILALTLQMSNLHRESFDQESSTSSDLQTLVGPLSGLTVSEILRPTVTAQPQHSFELSESIRRSSRIPRPIPPSAPIGRDRRYAP